jgi:nucleoside-diphosphate-sugar epimerase
MIERGEIDADDPGVVELPSLRSYVRPEDVARCFRLALEAEGVPFDVFNVAGADSFAPEPTLAWVERQFGALPEIRRPKLFAERPNAAAFDISRARERLGWEPEGDWASLSLVAVESV